MLKLRPLGWSDGRRGVQAAMSVVRHDERAATNDASNGAQVQLPPLRSNYSLARLHCILTMKRCLAAFAIAASLFAPAAHAKDALEAKVRAYVPVYALASVCDIRVINAAASNDHHVMLEEVKSDPDANKLLARLQSETQAAYIKARDAGNRHGFCKDFIAANSQYAKARVTAVVEGHMSTVNDYVRASIAHDVCKQGDTVKFSTVSARNGLR
jgi:hypothetical protein